MVRLSLALIVVASCSYDPLPLPAGDDEPGIDGPQACSSPATCADSQTLTTCVDGALVDRTCTLGCDPVAPHCRGLVPSNGIPQTALTDGDAALITAQASLLFDTVTGEIAGVRAAGTGYDPTSKIAFQIVAQAGAPSIGVFSMASLEVAANTTIRAVGANALAIVTEGAITIAGVIDVTGGVTSGVAACNSGVDDLAQCAGPGGMIGGAANTAAAGDGGGGFGSGGPQGFAESGGGGGGHGTAGASGGAGTTNNTTVGTPGPSFGLPALTPLFGGGGGGGGGNEPQAGTLGARGGGGGGAIQLVSNAGIALTGTACGINAGGGGAGGSALSSGGGGGGAGGGILLESINVSLAAGCILAANGGGGSGASNGQRGTSGLLSISAAPGSLEGSGGTRNAGNGGAGGALGVTPVAGQSHSDEAGGGGGAVGTIHIKSTDGAMFTNAGGVSPAPTQSAILTN